MDKEKYIEQGLLKLAESSLLALYPYGTFFIVLLSILDYFVTPENFTKFLVYRLITASLVLILFFIFKLKRNKTKRFTSIFIIITTLTVASMVELMIFSLGRHQSTYYAGMIVVITFILGFLHIPFRLSLSTGTLVYAIYLVPILLLDDITNVRIFMNNNIFLIGSILGAFGWKYFNQKLNIKKLSLEYDITQQKEQLAKYSTQLEELVIERTKGLTTTTQKYSALFDNSNDGVVVLNKDGIILDVNQKFCELHGFDKNALIGTHIRLLEAEDNEDEQQERLNRILNGAALIFETEHYRKDGGKIHLEVSSKAIVIGGQLHVQSLHRDITEKKKLQEQLFQSQKMESIGLLAGGIAHDFNNILTGILGHAELLHEYSELDATSKQRVKTIENSARKAGQMVSKLLSFARKGNFQMQPLNLNDVARDTIDLLERMMAKKNIEIKMEFDNTIFPINGDGNQLEQVIMNLVVNAGDAMSHGGAITIATSLAEFGNNASSVHPLLAPGKYVVLKISDTGTGIPDEIKNRIFDPFFTTKEPGKGTGLGLSMVYGIVKEHKGVINVKSRLGRGATFEVYLPASDRVMHKVERVSTYSMTGREKILVVDDEGEILSFIKDVLESQGYRVVATDNPVYARDILKEIAAEIDLLITDIVMPLVNGKELIRLFKRVKPNVKVIAISGYDIWNIGKKDRDINAYIRKPFEGIYLLSVVRKVLDAESSTTLSMLRPM